MRSACETRKVQYWYTYLNENNGLLYTGKLLCRKFHDFSFNHKCFPANHGHVDQQDKSTQCYSETFTANSYFPLKTQRFSRIPYMVLAYS